MGLAQGQFTIVDYNDAITLSGYLSSSIQKNQRYLTDSTSYIPDWTTSKPVITPNLFLAGSQEEIIANKTESIKSITWFVNDVKVISENENDNDNYSFVTKPGGHGGETLKHKLKIKKNVMGTSDSGLEVRCDIIYYDSTSTLDLLYSMSLSFSLTRDGGGLVAIEVTTPDGEVFKNNQIDFLRVVSKLWRGSVIDEEDVDYKWAYMDDDGSSATFGKGWVDIGPQSQGFAIEGNTLKVYASAVPSLLTIGCAIKDITADQVYIDGVTLVDRSDPVEVIIQSTGGNVFKNGSGDDIKLTAIAYQGGVEIENNITYKWSQYNQHGALEESGPNSVTGQTAKEVTIKASMVSTKATFICEVTY